MENQTKNWNWLLTLTVLNTLILCVSGLPAVTTAPIPYAAQSVLFYSAAYLSQNFLFSVFLALFLVPIFYFIKSDVWKIIAAVVPTGFLLFMCFMNAKVFSFWRIYIDSSVLQLYVYGGSQVFEMSLAMIIWLWIAGILFFGITAGILLISKKISLWMRPTKWVVMLGVIYGFSQGFFIYFMMQNNMQLLQFTMKVPYFYDLSLARLSSDLSLAHFPKNSLSPELQTVLTDDHRLDYPKQPLQYHLPKKPLNVLLIVIDTLRYDMINPTNMPNLYHYAQKSDQFMKNDSGGDCTKPGVFSLFYGIPPTYWNSAIDHHQGSILIRAFQDNRYRLGLFASAPLTSPPFNKTVFLTVPHLSLTTPGHTALARDKKITSDMEHFLNSASDHSHPFFGFLFYDAPHAYNSVDLTHPFSPVASLNYFVINNETPAQPIYNLYKNAVLADDQLLNIIFQKLKKDHLRKNTVVIITADHGQEFNDNHNDYWEHASGFSKYQVRTPMIIRWPNQQPRKIDYPTTHYDLVPTLLKGVLGVSNPERDYTIGNAFFSKKQSPFVITGNYSYFALITDDYIMQFDKSGLYRFTNLRMNPLHTQQENPFMIRKAILEMREFMDHSSST